MHGMDHDGDDCCCRSAGPRLPRRDLLRAVGAGAAALGLGMAAPRARARSPWPAELDRDSILNDGLVLMGWDGAGWNNVGPMLAEGRLPHLAGLIAEGASVLPLELIGRTNTLTTWTQVFTGLTYDQTGVTGNNRAPTRLGPVTPSRQFPQHDHWIRGIPYEWTVPYVPQSDRGVKIGWFPSKSYLSRSTRKSPLAWIARHADAYEFHSPEKGGSERYIQELGRAAQRFAMRAGTFTFVHFDPDFYGHKHGEGSERYREEIVRADVELGEFRRWIPRANLIVMTDHGFDPGRRRHDNAPDAWAVTTLPVHSDYHMAPGQRAFATPRDIGTMLLEIYGADLSRRDPQIRGKRLLA